MWLLGTRKLVGTKGGVVRDQNSGAIRTKCLGTVSVGD